MYGQIFVPLDQSDFAERAVRPAVELAAAAEARLTLLSVGRAEDSTAYLRGVAGRLARPADVLVVEDDNPGLAIAAMATPDSLVSMATHGRTGVRRAVLGSVTEAVVRHVSGPVLLTGPFAFRQRSMVGGSLLVCLDGSERGEAILPAVHDWAKTFDMHVWLAAVVSPDLTERRHEVDADVVESGYLARIAHDLGAPATVVDWDVLHGPHPAKQLVQMAEQQRVVAVAMTTHGRSGLSRVVLGSVAAAVVHESPCPVLIVRSA